MSYTYTASGASYGGYDFLNTDRSVSLPEVGQGIDVFFSIDNASHSRLTKATPQGLAVRRGDGGFSDLHWIADQASPSRWNREPLAKRAAMSDSQKTFVLLKPDAVRRQLVGEIIGRFEAKGLVVEKLEMITVDAATAEKHYGEHKGKPFYTSRSSTSSLVARASRSACTAVTRPCRWSAN